MASNYKLVGFAYVSKTTLPGAGTGTTDDPYGSLNSAVPSGGGGSGSIVVVTGSYGQTVANQTYNSNLRIVGDGKVLFKGDGTGQFIALGGTDTLENLEIRDYATLIYSPYGTQRVLRCILRNGATVRLLDYNAKDYLVDSLLFNVDYTAQGSTDAGSQYLCFHHNLIFNSRVRINGGTPIAPADSYFDPACTLTVNSTGLPQNCNIRCSLIIDGTAFASLAAAAVAYPSLNTTLGNFSADPQFNKPESEDFTLRITSPHLNTIIGPRHLRFGTGYYFEQFNGASANDDVTTANCRLRSTANPLYTVAVLETSGFIWNDQGGLTIKPNSNGNYEGYVLTDKIRIFDRPQRLRTWNVVTGLNFDTDYPGVEPTGTQASANPSVFNNNVPDYTYAGTGTAGRKPNRLTERLRWSSNPNPDVADPSTWETGLNYVEFELDTELSYNPSPLRGNGAPDFNTSASAVQPVIARWVQMQLKTRNNYFSR